MFAQNHYSIISRGVEMMLPCPVQPGYCYLIHFDQPYKHARHYLGSTINLNYRLELHRVNHGAKLLQVVNDAGIKWHVSRIWQCPTVEEARDLESRLKGWHHDGRLCPECQHKPLDPLTLLYQGHYPFHVYTQGGRRRPMGGQNHA